MRFAGLVLVPTVILVGCGGSSTVTAPTVTAPSPTPPIAPPVLTSLIGTVIERTPQGERPLGGASVWGQ